VVATIRGLLLDLLTTGDQDRIQSAAEQYLAALKQGIVALCRTRASHA
jgi:hypothetical protein